MKIAIIILILCLLILLWDYSGQPVTFNVYQKTNLLDHWTLIGSTKQTSFTITNPPPTAFYTVTSSNAAGETWMTNTP